MSGVCVIPARGGSRRVPRKNIMPFAGKPMLAHPIQAAKDSKLFSEIYVSTEDEEIAAVAWKLGARVIARPPELAKNDVGTQAVMRHAVERLHLRPDVEVCCIYATTPLLRAEDLLKARHLLEPEKRPSNPLTIYRFNYVIAVEEGPDLKDIGWFYYGLARCFAADTPLWGPYSRQYMVEKTRAIGINTPEDWALAEIAYKQMRRAA